VRVSTAFNRMLAIDGASVTAVAFTDDGVVVTLRRRARRHRCPCGAQASGYDRSVRRWRHLDLAASKLWLEAEIWRVDCRACRRVRTEEVPWARPQARHSRDFEDVVGWMAQRTDKTTTATLLRCSWEAVDGIVKRLVDEHLDDTRLDGLFHLGVDEIAYRRGHQYLTVVADHDTGRVVWVAKGRSKAVMAAFYEALGEERRAQIKAISMDMSAVYREATREGIPDAVICLDPFHAMKWVNEALEHVYRATPFSELGLAGGARQWRRTRTALRTAAERLEEDQQQLVAQIRRRRYTLWRAWELKELFRALYKRVAPGDARAYLKVWCTTALRSRIPAFRTLVKRIRNHFDGIAAAVEWGLSNSRLEGINAKIRLINNRAHGHRSATSLAASIYLSLGGIDLRLPTQT
jgi:transposase